MAVVVANLNDLLAEINECGPDRDKASDGAFPNAAHLAGSSDHNPDDTSGVRTPHTDSDTIPECHARDFDASGPWLPGITTAGIVSVLVARMRALGNAAPLAYIISASHIYEYPDFDKAPYTATSDTHDGHFHCSSRYGSGSGSSNPENYTGSWGLREAFLMLSTDDKTWINARLAATVASVWSTSFTLPDGRVVTAGTIMRWLDAAELDTRNQILAAIAEVKA